MSQLYLYRYVFVERGGGVCSSRVEKARRVAGYCLFPLPPGYNPELVNAR